MNSKINTSEKIKIPGVQNIIFVSSCKGGVGKSTIAFYLALSLSSKYKIGLLDADIYGPSIPALTNIYDTPSIKDGYMLPHIFQSIKVNSIGYLVPQNQALVWRGPMLTKALNQLFIGTRWNELDLLIVDMPPGTGDIHITGTQKYKIDGVLLVTTPQSLALSDLNRTYSMYKTLGANMIGLVENMSYFVDGKGTIHELFDGKSELKKFAKDHSISVLQSIPLHANNNKITPYIETISQKIAQLMNLATSHA